MSSTVTPAGSAASAAPSDGLPDGLGDDLSWLLARAARGYHAAAANITTDVPGGLRGHHLMRVVAQGCPATQLELAAALGLDRTVLTYLVDDLAAAGLVERQADPADRRARRVVVTAAGHTQLTRVERDLASLELRLLPDLSGEARTAVLDVLRTLITTTDPAASPREDSC